MTLTPLVLAGLILVFETGGGRGILFTGITMGAMFDVEARVGPTLVIVCLAGIGIYWLLAHRRRGPVLRLLAVGAISCAVAAPAVWYFAQDYLVGGGGFAMLGSSQDQWATYGPGLSGFPSSAVLLGLEPNELARMAEPIVALSRLAPLNATMSAAAGVLGSVLMLVVAIGVFSVGRRSGVSLALVLALLTWLVATRLVLSFPYGYFKLLNVGAPLVVGLMVVGGHYLWELGHGSFQAANVLTVSVGRAGNSRTSFADCRP